MAVVRVPRLGRCVVDALGAVLCAVSAYRVGLLYAV